VYSRHVYQASYLGKNAYLTALYSGAKEPSQPSIAPLLERGPSGLVPLSQISEQFNLTQREGEVLEYLLQGISSKVIANRVILSPSTVKTFLRLIMIKTGASSRAESRSVS
jgi:two-component system nitrate/nitrite response regulator NarL